jgi:hypothetical protein
MAIFPQKKLFHVPLQSRKDCRHDSFRSVRRRQLNILSKPVSMEAIACNPLLQPATPAFGSKQYFNRYDRQFRIFLIFFQLENW